MELMVSFLYRIPLSFPIFFSFEYADGDVLSAEE